jgi:hypothetical protein
MRARRHERLSFVAHSDAVMAQDLLKRVVLARVIRISFATDD